MLGLNRKLPPFSSDIAGACAALFGLGGVVVVHEPACCTSCYTTYDEPRYYGSSSPLYSSELREIHLSTGDDETILRRIETAVGLLDCMFIAIIGSPIPMFAGTDYRALAAEIERRTAVPAFSVDTGGFQRYDEGASEALLQLAKRFVLPADKNNTGKVNIIGAVAIDGIRAYGANGLVGCFESRGVEINSVFSDGSSIDEIAGAAEADRNIVVSVSGLKTAEYLKDRFGIPYSCGIPVGCLTGVENKPDSKNESVLIIGDQIISNSIRNCLNTDLGYKNISVSSFFKMNEALMGDGDNKLDGEDDLERLLGGESFDIVIGDPAFERFTKDYSGIRFVPVPHTPVSGFSPLREEPFLIGEAGYNFLKDSIRNC